MGQYIPKDVLVAEIDNILDYADEHWDTDYVIGAQKFADKLRNAINTLEVQELDLDTEIMKYQREIYDRDTTVRDVAKYFFELCLKMQKGEINGV